MISSPLASLRTLALSALLALGMALPSFAHALRPLVAEAEVNETTVDIVLHVSIEALIAGMDVTTVTDTRIHPLASRYEELRAEDPAALEASLRAAWPEIAEKITLLAGETRVPAELVRLNAPEVGDLELPRISDVYISAKLPPDGTPVQIGWDRTFGSVVLREMGGGEDAYAAVLDGGAISLPLPRQGYVAESALPVFGRFIVSGFEHIVPKGLDHILFVLGLFFFSLRLGPLLWQVTAFTLAHTVTLALATLKIVSIPASVVEPLIAASIVYVAVENILGSKAQVGWSRIAIVFGFGLLHGLGFASVLSDVGLPEGRLFVALIGFNIGVELGQLAVIAAAFVLLALPFGQQAWYRTAIAIPASLAIAGVGAWWTFERVFL